MITYYAELRHEYPFNKDSILIDVGAFNGIFSMHFAQKYGCRIFAFEPIHVFAEVARRNLAPFGNWQLHELAISDSDRDEEWAIKGDMTSFHATGDVKQKVALVDVAGLLDELGLQKADLLKLNCEGSEYAILDRLLQTNQVSKFANIQIQWHACIPCFFMRRARISVALERTHELTWQDPNFANGHENWRIL